MISAPRSSESALAELVAAVAVAAAETVWEWLPWGGPRAAEWVRLRADLLRLARAAERLQNNCTDRGE